MIGRTAVLLAVTLSAGAALAQEAGEDGRYTIVPAPDGAWRIDRSTGAVSHCAGAGAQTACRLLPDERVAVAEEIDRLNGRIDRLEARLGDLEAERGLVAPEPAPAPPAMPRTPEPDMPTQDELDKALEFTERAFRGFLDMVERLKRDYGAGDQL
ncbi:hypothetical protein ACUN0C_00590 [Faunimonas sp. B44]|uniref:hypothetical protein n=1 Tax=Faunimonas sp. B44 TaxID=3461493 RepID=UPI0040447F3A